MSDHSWVTATFGYWAKAASAKKTAVVYTEIGRELVECGVTETKK